MSDNTHFLQMPYILPSQAQKHVTHNEALRMLDAIVHLSVLDVGVDTPPVSPVEGDRYVVGQNPSAEWSGQGGNVAAFVDGAWIFLLPVEGWLAWNATNSELVLFAASGWQAIQTGGDQFDQIGINGTATAQERLVVQSQSILFNHDGDDQRLKLNKAATGDTASLLFQTGFSGRAEFGLPGEDAFVVKVSGDGASWYDAMRVNNSNGEVAFPASGVELSGSLFNNLLPDSGRFNASSNQHKLVDGVSAMPGYLKDYNSSTISFPHRFFHNNSTYGGTGSALDASVDALVQKIFGPGGARYGPEFWLMQIVAGSGTASPLNIDGEQYFRQTIVDSSPRPARFTSGCFVKTETGKTALRPPTGSVYRLFRNGLQVDYGTSGVVVTPADGWVYFEMQIARADLSYDQNDLSMMMLPSSTAYFALPRVAAGWVTIGSNIAVMPNDRVFEA